MKKKDLKTLRNKSKQDLRKTLIERQENLAKSYIKMKGGQEKNLKKSWRLRKDIAQILTLIREKEMSKKSAKK